MVMPSFMSHFPNLHSPPIFKNNKIYSHEASLVKDLPIGIYHSLIYTEPFVAHGTDRVT